MINSSLKVPLGLALLGIAAIVYGLTAYPTITWWDSSSYSLAAATLGIESPPGSLLLTLLGWPVAKLAGPAQVAHSLNLLAALITAGTVAMVFVNATELLENARSASRGASLNAGAVIGAALGALLFASTTTTWAYAVRFTPYGLSALVTTILFFLMAAWWRRADDPNGWILLAVLSFVFGLDFSVHRTNALLIPGALAWVLIRKPSAVLSARTLVFSFTALVAGLSVQLLIIPIAARGGSPLNFSNPNTLGRLWDYVTLKQLGGGFLLQLFPRKSAVWSNQVADVAGILRDNFFSRSGGFGILGYAPGVAAIIGAIALIRANGRLTAAVLSVVAIQLVATVLYFNIPADYFRSFDRHYLPICAMVGILGACGVGAVFDWATREALRPLRVAVAAAACVVPVACLASSYHPHDASMRYFAHDWATNALTQLPPNAVYLTVGDNDTFPAMYVQAVEGVRPDVTIINTSIALLPEWRTRLRATDSTFPLTATITTDSISFAANFPRPVAYAVTAAGYLQWPKDSGRFEGLHWTLAPPAARAPNLAIARHNLLEISNYRGYGEPSVDVDATTSSMAFHYYFAALELLKAERGEAGPDQCRADRAAIGRLVPPDRIALSPDARAKLDAVCN